MEVFSPKGSMCSLCVRKKAICSHLDFSKMKVLTQIELNGDTLKFVRCTEFKRENDDNDR